MRKNASQSIRGSALFLIMLGMFSCDSFNGDSVDPEKQVTFTAGDYFTLPGSSIIIDLKTVIKESIANVSLRISKDPERGSLSVVSPNLLKYKPLWDFVDGEDHFILSALSDGKILTTKTVTIKMKKSKEEFPCALITVRDKVKGEPGSTISIPILENDRLCDIDKSSVDISIYEQPLFGQGVLEGDHILYTPGSDYKGHDEFIYTLSTSDDEQPAYGIVSISEWTMEPINLDGLYPFKVIFQDENTGYLVTGGIYKTSDGGKHWTQTFSSDKIEWRSVNDLQFLDANNGFAIYCDYDYDWVRGCGVATTKNGGSSWSVTPIKPALTGIQSVFFASITTGFIVGFDYPRSVIFKTEDGGQTWKNSPIDNYSWLPSRNLTFEYADSHTGYAYQDAAIFITKNGGDIWEPYEFYNDLPSVRYDDIHAMAVIDENTLFASVSVINSFTHPSSIVKLENGSKPKEVAVIPAKIWELEFSPSGNVGFAVGTKRVEVRSSVQVLKIYQVLTIYKSIDRGETWTEEYIEEIIPESVEQLKPTLGISVPSENTAYIIYAGKLIKYSNR